MCGLAGSLSGASHGTRDTRRPVVGNAPYRIRCIQFEDVRLTWASNLPASTLEDRTLNNPGIKNMKIRSA